jgi:hypothetical protein
MKLRQCFIILAMLSPAVALAQPALDSLWPNSDGNRWEYELTHTSPIQPDFTSSAALWLQGTAETAGGTAQVLNADHTLPVQASAALADPVLAAVWRARPDLRAAIAARTGVSLEGAATWWPLLLHGGYFMEGASSIQMWQPDWNHPTWTYLTDDLAVSSTFTHQLVPELADDVFLHGTVLAIDATVTTASGTFHDAVKMGYVIDYGWNEQLDELGNVIGLARSETRGHVHFVPGVGPVEMLEDFIQYVEIDCSPAACPQEWIDLLGVSTQTLALSLTNRVVPVTDVPWTAVKALYKSDAR